MISGKDRALLLYVVLTVSLVVWACFSTTDVLHCNSSENALLWAGKVSCTGCLYSF